MSVTERMDRQTFLANLRQSGLLSAEQLKAATERLPVTDRGKVVARTLVEQGVLTRFQAELILGGRTSGFILGQYRILEQLGRGGMGRVFKAEHQAMNRVVALKVLSSALVKTAKAQQMFQREVRAAARLVHPNIVTAYDANQIDNRYYLVMEYVNGPNLNELVRQRGPLPMRAACDVIRQAAQGLQYAHEQGMVHRDIKPANLLVQPGAAPGTHIVKILDFGLARLHSRPGGLDGASSNESILTAENTVMGTPDFLSPEQARNLHTVDIRSDLYSLGCTFYFLLTGRTPFPGGTTVEKLVRHGTEDPIAVEQLRHDTPLPVAAIVRKLMAKNPDQRCQTPGELALALAPFAAQAPALSSASAPAVPVARAVTGNPRQDFDFFSTDTPSDLGDEDAAIGTLPIDLSVSPNSAAGMPSVTMRRDVERQQHKQMMRALIVASCIVAGLIGLASWLMLRH